MRTGGGMGRRGRWETEVMRSPPSDFVWYSLCV